MVEGKVPWTEETFRREYDAWEPARRGVTHCHGIEGLTNFEIYDIFE